MKITWLGHSCFILDDGSSRCVVDPYSPGSVPGYSDISAEAEAVFCTHSHSDHSFTKAVKLTGKPFTMDLKVIHEYHDDCLGKKRGTSDILVFHGKDGIKAVHMGDIGRIPTDDEIAIIKDADVMMIPVGGYFTVDGAAAAEIVRKAAPRITVPMHFRSSSFGYDVTSGLEDFTSRFATDEIRYAGSSTIEVARDTAPGICVLTPKLAKA
ncbi:MAG: MBL fold metallo-hydrolase [Oscillospiraceae bacterium]|jgi:L-ascorbate metabolism protein UlaG (beta-lactamase superfamily)